jgi:hypothetical protein
VGERKEGWGVFGKTAIFFLPPSIQNRAGEGKNRAGGRPGGSAGGPEHGGGRGWGKMERRTRATYSGAHLGLGLLVEAAPREEAAVEMGLVVVARCGCAARQWRGGDGSVVRRDRHGAIYSRNKAVRGEIFVLTGAPARSWWPARIPVAGRRDGSHRVTGRLAQGDGTARAAMGWLGQRSWRGEISPQRRGGRGARHPVTRVK